MPTDTINDLVLRYEELREGGESVTPEEVCRDHPELLTEFRRVVARLEYINRMIGSATGPDGPDEAAAAGHEDLESAELTFESRLTGLRFHAEGGLGQVFEAHDTRLGRPVALKRIQARHAHRDDQIRRFDREARITARLDHPGIVPVHAAGRSADGRPCYVMRFVRGESLKSAIRQFHAGAGADPLALRQLLGRFIDVCEAVAYAHSRGVVHRDLKPDNVMLGAYGETLVVDWGLAKVQAGPGDTVGDTPPPADDAGSETLTGTILGTPAYMAPEQAAGRTEAIGPASDVYSLGATLYELLTGQAPFPNIDLLAVQDGRFPRPRAVRPGVPPALEAVCLKAMALRPADRYDTPLALAGDVERWLADEPVGAYPEPAAARAWRWVRRHRTLAATAAALVLTAAVAAIVGFVLVSRERDQKALALRDAVAARTQTWRALNTLTDDVVERLLGRRAQPGPDERAYLRKVQQYYEQFAAAGGDAPEDRARRADGYFRIGCVKDRLGDRDGAEASLLTAAELQTALVAEAGADDYRWNLGLTLMRLGSVRRDLGRLKEAEASWEDAQRHFAALAAADPGSAPHRAKQAEVQKNLGVAYTEDGRAAEAETATRAALEIDRRLVADFPAEPEYQNGLGADITNLANLLRETGRPEAALAEFRAARDVFVRLTEMAPTPEYRVRLGIAHDNLGAMLRLMNQPQQAEAEHRAGRAVQAGLAAEFPAVPEYRQSLSASLDNLALLLADTDRPAEAEALYRESYALRARLAGDFPKVPEYAHDLAATLINMAELDRKRGDPTRALARLAEAVPHQTAARAAEPRNTVFAAGYRENLKVAALALVDVGDYGPATERVEEMLRLDVEPPADAWFAAGALGRCAERVATDTRLTDAERTARAAGLDARALELARRAAAAGAREVANAATDPDLAALRRRPGFLALLWELADLPAKGP
jgi:serine/threonine-protein kinase